MYGKSDIYNPQFGLQLPSLSQVFSTPGRGAAAVLTGGASELVRGKKQRLEDAEERLEKIVEKLNTLHEQGKMDKAQKRAQKLANVVDQVEELSSKLGRPAKLSAQVRAWVAYGEDGDLASLERKLGKVLWTGAEEDGQSQGQVDGGGLAPQEGGMYIAAPASGLVPTHESGIRGGIQVGPSQYVPAYTAMPPSMSYDPYADYGPYPSGGGGNVTNIFVNRPGRRPGRPAPAPAQAPANISTPLFRPPRRPGRPAQPAAPRRKPLRRPAPAPASPTFKPVALNRFPAPKPKPVLPTTRVSNRFGKPQATLARGKKTRMGGLDPRTVDGRGVDLRGVDSRDVDTRLYDTRAGGEYTIGADAFSILKPSGLIRADILGSTVLDDLVDFEDLLEEEDDSGEEEAAYGLFRRDIEKDVESVRRKIEQMNRKGIRSKRDQKQYDALMRKFEHLQQVMVESRARSVPRYADPVRASIFRPDTEDFVAEAYETGGGGFTQGMINFAPQMAPTAGDMEAMEIIDLEMDPEEEQLISAIHALRQNGGPQSEIDRLERELSRFRAGV